MDEAEGEEGGGTAWRERVGGDAAAAGAVLGRRRGTNG